MLEKDNPSLPPLTILDIIKAIDANGGEYEWQALRHTALSIRANRKGKPWGEINFQCENKYANDLFRDHSGAEYFPVVLWLPRAEVDKLVQGAEKQEGTK